MVLYVLRAILSRREQIVGGGVGGSTDQGQHGPHQGCPLRGWDLLLPDVSQQALGSCT